MIPPCRREKTGWVRKKKPDSVPSERFPVLFGSHSAGSCGMRIGMQADNSKDGSTWVTDERFNTCAHLAGAVFALFGAVLLIVCAGFQGKPWQMLSFCVYGVCLVTLFVSSALHHGVRSSARVEALLRQCD